MGGEASNYGPIGVVRAISEEEKKLILQAFQSGKYGEYRKTVIHEGPSVEASIHHRSCDLRKGGKERKFLSGNFAKCTCAG